MAVSFNPSLLYLLVFVALQSSAYAYTGKVLIVSFDGFRWDYLNNIDGLENFKKLEKEGVRAPYMNSTFTTSTFPNHYSIATGLYQENHGIILNKMYDPNTDAWFNKGRSTRPGVAWWDGGEPLWITAVKRNRTSAVIFWAGSDATIRGHTPTHVVTFSTTYTWENKVADVIRWFKEEDVDLVMVYHNQPDEAGHWFGPYTQQTNDSVKQMDSNLATLRDALHTNDLSDKVNLLVVSDHGMVGVSSKRLVDLHDYVQRSQYKAMVAADSICMILPQPGDMDNVFTALDGVHPNMTVYKKEDLPDRWHYKSNDRILPIVIIMDEGWQCVGNKSDPWYARAGGTHGYDNQLMSMKAIFLAAGPDIRTNYVAPSSINNLDIYPMTCKLLGITPSPNNGSIERMEQFFRDASTSGSKRLCGDGSYFINLALLLVLFTINALNNL